MNVDDRMGSCRDKGRGGVDEGALCLSWLGCDLCAPRSPHWIALPPGQAQGPHPALHPPLVPTGPHAVVNIHQVSRLICQSALSCTRLCNLPTKAGLVIRNSYRGNHLIEQNYALYQPKPVLSSFASLRISMPIEPDPSRSLP